MRLFRKTFNAAFGICLCFFGALSFTGEAAPSTVSADATPATATTPPIPAPPPVPAENAATPQRYPTLQLLDFALSRRLSVEIGGGEQCGGSPLSLRDLSLSKPMELPIDLPAVMRLAGCDNLDLRLACAVLDESRAHVLAAKFNYLPSLRPYFENRWHTGFIQATAGPFSYVNKQATQYGPNAVGEWHVGETFFQVLAAKRRSKASEAGVLTASEEARLKAVNAYFSLVEAGTDLAIAEQRLTEAGETVTLTQNLVKGGAALLSEVKRTQAILAEVKQRVSSAREHRRQTSLALTDALHVDPLVTLIPLQESTQTIDLVSKEKELPELVADGLSRRPELKESRGFWRAIDAERKASFIAPLIPTVYAQANPGLLGRHPSDVTHSADYSVGFGWKIGAGGIGDISRTRISEAQLKEEGIRFAAIGDRIAREVVENYTHMRTMQEQIELSKEEIEAAEESLRLSNERLKGGTALTLEVTTAEDALFGARSRAANNVTEFNKAQYALLRSIGGFNESDCTQPTAGDSADKRP